MARDIESLVLQMSVDLRRWERSMDRMTAVSQKRLTAVEAQALKTQKNLERTMAQAGEGMVAGLSSGLKSLAPTLAAAFSVQQIVKYADNWSDLNARVRQTVGAHGDAEAVMDRISSVARRTYSDLNQTAEGYLQNAGAMRELGYSTADTLDYVEAVNNALVISGTKGEVAQSVMNALGKAMAFGELRGENLNTVIQNGGRLTEALAASLGVTTLELRRMGEQGLIKTDMLVKAMTGSLAQLRTEADAMPATIGDALQLMNNALGKYVGQTDQSLSATQRMAEGIIVLSDNLDTIVPVLGVLVGLVGGRYVWAMTAATGAQIANGVSAARLIAFQTAMTASMTGTSSAALVAASGVRTFNAAIAANPIGAVLVGVTALAAAMYLLKRRADEGSAALQEQKRQSDLTKTATDKYREAVDLARTANGEAKKAALAVAEARRQETIQTIENTREQLNNAKAVLAAARARQVASEEYMNSFAGVALAGGGGIAGAAGQASVRSGRQADITDAQRVANGYLATLTEAEKKLAEIDAAAKAPAVVAVVDTPDRQSSRASSGPSQQDLTEQRAMLDMEAQLAVLRARGRDKEAEQLSDRIETIKLTKTYQDAGFADAQAKAAVQVHSLREAADTAEFIAKFEKDQARFLEEATAERQRQAALAEDELGLRAEIARLLGDEAGYQAAQREYDLTRRTADLRAKGLGEDEARQQATSETDRLRGAEIVGGLGSGFRDPLEQMRAQYEEIDRLRQADVLSEQEAAAAKAQANALYQEQRLASATGFFATLAELQDSSNKELAAIGKAAAIAQATMDGYVAVQKALASAPPPFNYALAAAVGVVAAANVAKIAGMADGGQVQGVGGPRQDNQLRWLSVGEHVINAKSAKKHRALLEAINSGRPISGLADGGIVGVPNIPDLSGLSAGRGNSLTYSPTIDARGADMAAVARLEALMVEERRQFANKVMGVVDRKAKYRLGKNAED
nr:tape measure protein [uncultured Brevundimonas sp.]